MQTDDFKELIWQKGAELFRSMPWRTDTRPYYVLVSELMLQQTQVQRVIPKFQAFIEAFPDERTLAQASLADVLTMWQGLGYNRRAKFLHESAQRIASEFKGVFPESTEDILSLPGVGRNTLGAIEAYAYNRPSIFIETNIRTVFIHHFFNDRFDVSDGAISDVLKATIDMEHPREFYWAIMDYGSRLKSQGIRNNVQSKHYKKQSPLEGSVRQVRGLIIRELAGGKQLTRADISALLPGDERVVTALAGLEHDGLITIDASVIHLTK